MSALSTDQWTWLMQRHTPLFDVFADVVSDINALMEENRMSAQTVRLAFHLSMIG